MFNKLILKELCPSNTYTTSQNAYKNFEGFLNLQNCVFFRINTYYTTGGIIYALSKLKFTFTFHK